MATKHLSLRRLFSNYCEIVERSQPGPCPSPGCGASAALSEYGTICSRGHLSDNQGTLPIGRMVDLAGAFVPVVWRDAGQAVERDLEIANRMLHSLYEDGDVSVDQYSAIERGLLCARETIGALAVATEDNAMLLSVLRDIEYGCDWMPERIQRLLNRISEAEHPGRALMGELTRRMSAAQAVIDVARAALGAPLFEHRQPLEQALADYDQAIKE